MHINTVGSIFKALTLIIFYGAAVADGIGCGGSLDFSPGQITGRIFGPAITFIGQSAKGQAKQLNVCA